MKYIQQCPNWYFVTKKGNEKKIVKKKKLNKITLSEKCHWRWKTLLKLS